MPSAKATSARALSAKGPMVTAVEPLTSAGAPLDRLSARSRSWIIRSSTTETSAPRPVWVLRRTASIRVGRSGAESRPMAANTARSWWPQASTRPRSAALPTRARAPASVEASGFST